MFKLSQNKNKKKTHNKIIMKIRKIVKIKSANAKEKKKEMIAYLHV